MPAPTLEVRIAPPHPLVGRFDALNSARSAPHQYFAAMLDEDPRMRGRVLDVGCGSDFPRSRPIRSALERCERLDGVEPDPAVEEHPGLETRWCCGIEDADLPPGAYDAVISFWVLEHLRRPDPFMRKTFEALKPGGVVYAFTPHVLHPFAMISGLVQIVQLKRAWRFLARKKINDYPAYYRANRRGAIAPAAERAGFARAEFHYIPCLQWDTYFPPPLRLIPHLYDRAIGIRYRGAGQVFVFKLERGEGTS